MPARERTGTVQMQWRYMKDVRKLKKLELSRAIQLPCNRRLAELQPCGKEETQTLCLARRLVHILAFFHRSTCLECFAYCIGLDEHDELELLKNPYFSMFGINAHF